MTLSQVELNYHAAQKHSVPRLPLTYKCKLCHAEVPGFYTLHQHKDNQHETRFGFEAEARLMWRIYWEMLTTKV